MARGRIVLSCAGLLLACAAATTHAQMGCSYPDAIYVSASSDTIFVQHDQAEMNCCTNLVVDIEQDGFTVDFLESETGDFCLCLCCFDIDYEGHGFVPGHYLVRVWQYNGNVFIGQGEVDIEGNGTGTVVGLLAKGDCIDAEDVADDPRIHVESWGRLRSLYR
jgi:hypothetical protein